MSELPKKITKVIVPPIKCQGIKTKLIPFIASNISWDGQGRWVEPFLGSGVVAFNINPQEAILSDTNEHIIRFYQELQAGKIDKKVVTCALQEMGDTLSKKGKDYFYEIRETFNRNGGSLNFLFLNRSCFNGLMRFNSKGGFNVPFGHKPNRFSKAYITKIANQVERVSFLVRNRNWTFKVADWEDTLRLTEPADFVYLDPPYIGRHTDYFNGWSSEDAVRLSDVSNQLPCKYALSMWLENKYRKNAHLEEFWTLSEVKTFSHFYHVGSNESYRNQMTEALVTNQLSAI